MSDYKELTKLAGVLSTSGREHIKKINFALPDQRKYPIQDISHARNALSRVAQFGSDADKEIVRSKVYDRYPALKKRSEEGK